jgi:hypothetical protein
MLQTTSGSNSDMSPPNAPNWNASFRQMDEKRRSVRRAGVPTPLLVMDMLQARKAFEAFVLDRSTGGIRIAIQKPLSIGASLQVRPQNSTEEVPWIPVLVRNCREVGDYYEVGCQFEKELPWNLLLLFG